MQPVVSNGIMWQGKCRRSGKPDETKTSTSQGFEIVSPMQLPEPKASQVR